jgi:hypothetical protein
MWMVVRDCVLNETRELIALVEQSRKEEFRARIDALREAMGWTEAEIEWTYIHTNCLLTNFKVM